MYNDYNLLRYRRTLFNGRFRNYIDNDFYNYEPINCLICLKYIMEFSKYDGVCNYNFQDFSAVKILHLRPDDNLSSLSNYEVDVLMWICKKTNVFHFLMLNLSIWIPNFPKGLLWKTENKEQLVDFFSLKKLIITTCYSRYNKFFSTVFNYSFTENLNMIENIGKKM